MSVLVSLIFGLPLLVQGIRRNRRRATLCGSVLLTLATAEVLYVLWTIRSGGQVPEIALHGVLSIGLSFWLAVVGNHDLKSTPSRE